MDRPRKVPSFYSGEKFNINKNPEAIISKEDYSLISSQIEGFSEPSSETVDYLKSDYDTLVRGHSLFKLIGMILHRKDRRIKYNDYALYEICYKLCKSRRIKLLQNKIKHSL